MIRQMELSIQSCCCDMIATSCGVVLRCVGHAAHACIAPHVRYSTSRVWYVLGLLSVSVCELLRKKGLQTDD